MNTRLIIKTNKGSFRTIARSDRKKGYHAQKLNEFDSHTYWVKDCEITKFVEITKEEKHKTDAYFTNKINKNNKRGVK